jgi:ParB-like nuclease domain
MDISTDLQPVSPPADLGSHPAASLFPLLEVDSPEFGELVQDIREHGLLQPIVLCDGKILDGRNRYRACQHAGVEPRFEEWRGESPTAYVLSLNLHRRHLTEGQLATIAVEAKVRFEEEARERKRAHGQTAPGRPSTLRPNSDEVSGRDFKAERGRRSNVRAAKEVGVTRCAVRQAERVKEADPELFEKVRTGAVPLRGAAKEVERGQGVVGKRAKPRAASSPESGIPESESSSRPLATSPPVEVRAEDVAKPHVADSASVPAPQPQPANAVAWTLDGFLNRLVQVNATVERYSAAEIADLLMARVLPDPDLAIVRSALAHLGELDREIAARERAAR